MKIHLAHLVMRAMQYLYYVEANSPWTDTEYDRFCKRHALDGKGGSDLASSYPPIVKALAVDITNNPEDYPPFLTIQS